MRDNTKLLIKAIKDGEYDGDLSEITAACAERGIENWTREIKEKLKDT